MHEFSVNFCPSLLTLTSIKRPKTLATKQNVDLNNRAQMSSTRTLNSCLRVVFISGLCFPLFSTLFRDRNAMIDYSKRTLISMTNENEKVFIFILLSEKKYNTTGVLTGVFLFQCSRNVCWENMIPYFNSGTRRLLKQTSYGLT